MGKIKVIFDRKACITSGICASLSDLWKVNSETVLKGAKLNQEGKYELILDETQLNAQKTVAASCPSGAIKVEKI